PRRDANAADSLSGAATRLPRFERTDNASAPMNDTPSDVHITGGCLCRRVRFEITARPIAMRMCWCRDCQYFASGNATVNVVFPSEAVRVEGELKDFVSVADSGNRMHRGFCPECGT